MADGLGIIDEDSLNIFTDGSSFPNKKRAAGVGVWFVWVNDDGHEETHGYAPPGWEKATIDEMEIMACSVALQEAHFVFPDMSRFKKILIFSDSRYVVDNFFNAINIWPNRKWLKVNKMPVANIDLWKKLRKEVKKSTIPIAIEWVKAHKKNTHNRQADKLAKQSASLPVNKPLTKSETTSKWSDRSTKRGCILMLGQDIKIRIISRKYIRIAKTTEYRYEVVDPRDRFFKDIDFIYCDEDLSRNQCYTVLLNKDQNKPYIAEIIEELDYSDYKYDKGAP